MFFGAVFFMPCTLSLLNSWDLNLQLRSKQNLVLLLWCVGQDRTNGSSSDSNSLPARQEPSESWVFPICVFLPFLLILSSVSFLGCFLLTDFSLWIVFFCFFVYLVIFLSDSRHFEFYLAKSWIFLCYYKYFWAFLWDTVKSLGTVWYFLRFYFKLW